MTTPFRLVPSIASAVLGLAVVSRAADQTQAPLPKDSPFNPAAGGAVATAGASESWEFAAVQTIDKATSVNIYDKATKKGRWIAVGATADGIAVKSYDAARDLVVINVGGAEKTLGLRKSSAIANAPAVPAAQVTPPTGPWPRPAGWDGPPAAPAPTPDPAAAAAAPAPATAPAVPQPPPPAPGTIAHQEQEARMLVSDLLEIGIAQRKAYEEAQKKAAAERAAQGQTGPQSTR